jgi:hypothetical protein
LGIVKGVVGIENKVDSEEQTAQISDYQEALTKRFPKMPKIIFFLTPDGRETLTSSFNYKECPCIIHPYKSIVDVCDLLLPNAIEQSKVFLLIIKNHINKLLKSNSMENEVKEKIHNLYLNPEYRQTIKLIQQFSPRINTIIEKLESNVYQIPFNCKGLGISEDEISFDTYPSAVRSQPNEFQIFFDSLSNKYTEKQQGYIHYILKSDSLTPDIGSVFTLRVAIYFQDAKTKKELGDLIYSKLSIDNSKGEKKHWSNWINLWVGDSYRLVDLGDKDIRGLTNILNDGISETFLLLKKKLTKLK